MALRLAPAGGIATRRVMHLLEVQHLWPAGVDGVRGICPHRAAGAGSDAAHPKSIGRRNRLPIGKADAVLRAAFGRVEQALLLCQTNSRGPRPDSEAPVELRRAVAHRLRRD